MFATRKKRPTDGDGRSKIHRRRFSCNNGTNVFVLNSTKYAWFEVRAILFSLTSTNGRATVERNHSILHASSKYLCGPEAATVRCPPPK